MLKRMFPVVKERQQSSSQPIKETMIMMMMLTTAMMIMIIMVMMSVMMMRRMLPTAQEDKIFRAVSSPLLLDKFSCVEDDRTEGRAHLTRRLLLLLQHHFLIFWTYLHFSESSILSADLLACLVHGLSSWFLSDLPYLIVCLFFYAYFLVCLVVCFCFTQFPKSWNTKMQFYQNLC